MLNMLTTGEISQIIATRDLVGGDPFYDGDALGVVGDTVKAGQEVAIIHMQEMEYTVECVANTAYRFGAPVFFKTPTTLTLIEANRFLNSPKAGHVSRAVASGAGKTSMAARVRIKG